MKYFLLFALIIGLTTTARAQQWDTGELEDVEIEIVRERQISLPRANRNFEKIPPRPAEPVKTNFQYEFKPFSFQTAPLSPAIRPLKLKQEESAKVYNGYVSAGYGNYASPYLEGFINSGKDRNKLFGARGLFTASDKGPVDGRNSGSGLTLLSLYGKTFNEKIALSGDVGYENRSTHFYGYPDGTVVEAKSIKQYYNTIRLKGDISNARNTDFSYKLGGSFSHLSDKFDAKETEFGVEFRSRYKINPDAGVGLDASYNLINRKDALIDLDPRSLFRINPRYEFVPIENLRITAGLIAAIENDSIGDKNVHAYPDISASYPLSPSVQIHASLSGDIEKVTLQSLSNENIWLAPNVDIFHTNKLYDFKAGLNTRIGSGVTLNGGFSLASLRNWYFFVNDPADQSRFLVGYETGETTRTNFYASIGYAKAEKINVMLRGDVFSYKTDEVFDEAIHRPTYRLTADASFNIVDKLLLTVKAIGQGGMKAIDATDGELIDLDAALDLNTRLEYFVSERISVFAQLNNITSNEYPLFLNYPARGFQALGGVTWKF